MSYIIWKNYGYEGWSPSEELQTIDDCLEWLKTNHYGEEYKITKLVNVKLTEVEA